MRTEVLQPSRHFAARPVTTIGRRISWRCGPADEVEPHLHGAATPARNAAKRVLVVDDESSIRMLCRVNLTASGIEVLEAGNGRDAVELIRQEKPDLVLLDVMMPDLDGWEVARQLAADPKTREIPIVFLTARAGEDDRRLGEQLGGVGYVVKPFDPVRIGQMVEEVLTRIEQGEREALRRGILNGMLGSP
ncbi:MAG: response regulator transcription factor [Gaiellaceae bacterium]